jgi:hypothetical protein
MPRSNNDSRRLPKKSAQLPQMKRGLLSNVRISPYDSVRIRLPVQEVKLFPLSASSAFYNAAAGQYLVDLTAVTQGNSGAQRVGDVLTLIKLRIRAVINNGAGTTSNIRNISRVIFFQYFGDGSVANKPTIADFLQTSSSNIGTQYGSFSTYDIDYSRQYRVLWDSGLILTLGSNQLAVTGQPPIQQFHLLDMDVPLHHADKNIAFYTGGTTGPNHIYMLVTADQATIATNPSIEFSSELRFTDA